MGLGLDEQIIRVHLQTFLRLTSDVESVRKLVGAHAFRGIEKLIIRGDGYLTPEGK